MSIRRKAWLAVGGFAVGSLVLVVALRVADSYGVPHDILAMTGIGFAFVGGLASLVYVMGLCGFKG